GQQRSDPLPPVGRPGAAITPHGLGEEDIGQADRRPPLPDDLTAEQPNESAMKLLPASLQLAPLVTPSGARPYLAIVSEEEVRDRAQVGVGGGSGRRRGVARSPATRLEQPATFLRLLAGLLQGFLQLVDQPVLGPRRDAAPVVLPQQRQRFLGAEVEVDDQ